MKPPPRVPAEYRSLDIRQIRTTLKAEGVDGDLAGLLRWYHVQLMKWLNARLAPKYQMRQLQRLKRMKRLSPFELFAIISLEWIFIHDEAVESEWDKHVEEWCKLL